MHDRADLDALRAFSAAAARILEARPNYARFAHGTGEARALTTASIAAIARVPLTIERVRRAVRVLRSRVFVHTAAAELHGASPLDTGRVWSDAADAAIALCARLAAVETTARLGACTIDGVDVGRAVFALGKLGSRELNPSSDVDLIVAYERDGVTDAGSSAHEWHVQWARRLRGHLSDVDDDGFAFRVDYDLRPEGTAGPLANSVDALESYYERFGQTWERAALLRLRAVVDVGGVAMQVERRITPFVFPRSVSASAVDELFAMKQRVTAAADADAAAHTASGDASSFDVKRGRGGIREVEFVVQAHQLLHGGRLRDLRRGNVVELTARLEEHGFLPHKTSADLAQGYELLRRVEHALQYGEDRQTQALPPAGTVEHERVALAVVHAHALARSHGAPSTHAPSAHASSSGANPVAIRFADALADVRERVHAAFQRMLGEGRDRPSDDAVRALDRTLTDEARIDRLQKLGFVDDPERALSLVRVLERRRGSPLAPDVARTAEAQDAGAHWLDQVAKSPDPMTALARLPDLFLERVPRAAIAKVAHDRRTLALATRLLATSAPLSRMLARHHGLDELLARSTTSTAPRLRRVHVRADLDELARGRDAGDDEARLVAMRTVHSRRTLTTALAFFAGRIDVTRAAWSSSTLADGCIDEAVAFARAKMEARHGAVASMKFCVVALGSLGGRELGFFRDLDLAFVWDVDDDDAVSAGPRKIGAAEHAARTAQQVIWALTAPLAEGACYAVDPRLRPSGSHGALTTSIAAFRAYHATSQPWERQALLRARFVAGSAELGREAIAVAKAAALSPQPPLLGQRLLDMRARMVAERASHVGLDLKMGEGGLADVEFAVQGLELAHHVWSPSTRRGLHRLARRGAITTEQCRALDDAYVNLAQAREALALVDDKREPAVTPSDARLDLLARAGVLEGKSGPDVYARLARHAATIREISGRILMRLQ